MPGNRIQNPPDGPPDFGHYTADLSIIQQPDRARSCGNADRDRRCLDPPPVLKLEIRNKATGELDLVYTKRFSWIVQCFIYSADPVDINGNGNVPATNTRGRTLIRGNLVGNAQYVDLDIDGLRGENCYFCFPDLSFSTAGLYRLKFQWAWIDPQMSLSHVRSMGTMGYQLSDVFRVYSAKEFPSMLPMTSISLALKQHGLWIRGGLQRASRHPGNRAPVLRASPTGISKETDYKDQGHSDNVYKTKKLFNNNDNSDHINDYNSINSNAIHAEGHENDSHNYNKTLNSIIRDNDNKMSSIGGSNSDGLDGLDVKLNANTLTSTYVDTESSRLAGSYESTRISTPTSIVSIQSGIIVTQDPYNRSHIHNNNLTTFDQDLYYSKSHELPPPKRDLSSSPELPSSPHQNPRRRRRNR
ncbi:velvet factor-domain-containing protein [Dipodascopsis uninucleata]